MAITVIYLAVNAAYLLGLGFDGARQSSAIAADILALPLGEFGSKAMSLLVMISALGAVNGLIYTGSRVYSTLGEDYPLFGRLARWHPRRRSPVWSMSVQAAITLVLMTLLGTGAGRSAINGFLKAAGIGGVTWDGHGGFDTLLRCTAPVFWFFFLMTGISLFVLRVRDAAAERPFRVPFYPVLPLVFCGMCVYMLYSASTYAGRLIVVGVLPVGVGVLVYWAAMRRGPRRQPAAGVVTLTTTSTPDRSIERD